MTTLVAYSAIPSESSRTRLTTPPEEPAPERDAAIALVGGLALTVLALVSSKNVAYLRDRIELRSHEQTDSTSE